MKITNTEALGHVLPIVLAWLLINIPTNTLLYLSELYRPAKIAAMITITTTTTITMTYRLLINAIHIGNK